MSAASKAAIHAIIRSVILFGFTLYILYLSEKGALNYYIAPRMELYVKLAGLSLYALAVQQAFHAYRTWRKRTAIPSCDCSPAPAGGVWKHAAVYLFFLFPLMLGLFTPDTALGSKLVERKGMNYAASSNLQSGGASPSQGKRPEQQAAPNAADQQREQQGNGQNIDDAFPHSATESQDTQPGAADDAIPIAPQQDNRSGDAPEADAVQPPGSTLEAPVPDSEPTRPLSDEELNALFPEDNVLFSGYAKYARSVYNHEVIEVPEHSYTEVLTTLDLYKEQFVGKTIRISGFVYKPAELATDQFAITRYAMQCCSADAAPYGVLSFYPRAATLVEDEWLEVTGTIRTAVMNDMELLALDVQQVRKIEEPSDPYVYPNFDFGFE
ncbi:TIGR03943 family protein [Xylanibacillus composti]|uniref:TIGR03943 family protein n=1 Tax=Xylanibacillus composti TaxID=1572762 RepID=A0A8J4M137_9BACL|nr:TIGR03943 family protein [Xylanibacillus composti]MDT9726253.1 TIGR03943 family protein [Xylanibacillus composti]GIQ68104.1 hypothetical protein XYCOK13_09280 [Xylanibacillus composti]